MPRRLLCVLCASVLLLGVGVAPAAGVTAPAGRDPDPSAVSGSAAVTPSAADDTFPGVAANWVYHYAPFADTLTDVTDEHDYRRVYLEVGEYYEFTLTPEATVDFDLWLWGPTGEYLNSSSAGVGEVDLIFGEVDTAGYYSVDVRQYSGNGSYTLEGYFECPGDNAFTDPTFQTPGLSAGQASGSVNNIFLDGWSDWDSVHRIWLWPGDSISLGLSRGAHVGVFNPRLYIYDPSATNLWDDTNVAGNSSTAFPISLNYTATTPGYHYVDVYAPYFEPAENYGWANLTWSANFNLVYRFYNPRLGTHFYTATEDEKAAVIANLSNVYTYEGPSYRVDPAMNNDPIWRFYKPSTGTHFYTADPVEMNNVKNTMANIYTYEGPAYEVSRGGGAGYMPVWRFYRPNTGTHLYTADAGEMSTIVNTLGATYKLDGVAFYVGTGY